MSVQSTPGPSTAQNSTDDLVSKFFNVSYSITVVQVSDKPTKLASFPLLPISRRAHAHGPCRPIHNPGSDLFDWNCSQFFGDHRDDKSRVKWQQFVVYFGYLLFVSNINLLTQSNCRTVCWSISTNLPNANL